MDGYRLTVLPPGERETFPQFRLEDARQVRAFHETFPQYAPTPLLALPGTAAELGVGGIYIKDESKRFGLNAFKVLGGSYAMGRLLSGLLGEDTLLSYSALTAPDAREKLGQLTFVTATDGNHGRGVAWAAREFGHRSVVYMPKGSVPVRLENIRLAGAEAEITELSYDDAVRLSRANAEKYGWYIVQDTGWPGYEDVPLHIMQGYTTMGLEAWEQLPQKPTHIFLQAGVGSMAAAIAALFVNLCGEDAPKIVIVEPNSAECFYLTAHANDGQLHPVTGEMKTIMAGLACGEPCPQAWEILRRCARYYVTCPDEAAEAGMRRLAYPKGDDPAVVSGESGASAFGCALRILQDLDLAPIREELGLDGGSRLLFFSTEGDTDPENYRRILEK